METQFIDKRTLVFKIDPQNVSFFTLLLQSGILVKTTSGTSIGELLQSFPDFSTEYIINDIQTIFLNGTATDDLETEMENDNDTLAVSAAMPGLAGAIFRKNSLHAALRTTQEQTHTHTAGSNITVIVKFFNTIARDRGAGLLKQGVTMRADSIIQFLDTRSTLPGYLESITLDGKLIDPKELTAALSDLQTVHLSIICVK